MSMDDDHRTFLFGRWYLKPTVVFMITQDRCLVLQQALNNASIIRLSGIIPETLKRTGGYICLNEA